MNDNTLKDDSKVRSLSKRASESTCKFVCGL